VNLKAIYIVLKGEKISFPTTPKERQEGNFVHLVWPQIAVVILTAGSLLFAAVNYFFLGNTLSFTLNAILTNIFWATNNILAMLGMIRSAFWQPEKTA
jgi:cellulose synthase (UDP-forming)